MTDAPSAEEHRAYYTKLLPFAVSGTAMLVLHFGGDPGNTSEYFRIGELDNDGLTVTPQFDADDGAFRFTWSESAAMEIDIGRFLTGEISRRELDLKHPKAWVGLALMIAAEQELMRLERGGAAPAPVEQDTATRLRHAFNAAMRGARSHMIPVFPSYPQPFETDAMPVDLLIVRHFTDQGLNFISKRLNEEVTVSWDDVALNAPRCRACLAGEINSKALLSSHKANPEIAALLWEIDRLSRS
ncbi:MAG: hypothetical protein AB7Q23_09410 [Hyphomonadaceae bacterium]